MGASWRGAAAARHRDEGGRRHALADPPHLARDRQPVQRTASSAGPQLSTALLATHLNGSPARSRPRLPRTPDRTGPGRRAEHQMAGTGSRSSVTMRTWRMVLGGPRRPARQRSAPSGCSPRSRNRRRGPGWLADRRVSSSTTACCRRWCSRPARSCSTGPASRTPLPAVRAGGGWAHRCHRADPRRTSRQPTAGEGLVVAGLRREPRDPARHRRCRIAARLCRARRTGVPRRRRQGPRW